MELNNITLIGMPASGKSTVGVLLAKRLGLSFVDVDILIQEKEKRLLKEIIADVGDDGFMEIENRINAELDVERSVIAPGGSVIYGKEAMEHLKEISTVVYLKLSYEDVKERLGDLVDRGVVLKDGMTLLDLYNERVPYYEKYADITVDETGVSSAGETVDLLRKMMEERFGRIDSVGIKRIVEICCGSYYDAKQAALGGAERIELNSALQLGGLTPATATLKLVKQEFPRLKVVAMVRPRGAGFCYSEEDFKEMEANCRELMANGADGIAFGCLNPDGTLNVEQNQKLIEIIKDSGQEKEAVFHRAFDCTADPYVTIETLINLGVDRILTSGLKPKAADGVEVLCKLQKAYGDKIQILAGSGVNASNARWLMDKTGLTQVHSSCKDWLRDETTVGHEVSFSMVSGEQESCYDAVSRQLVEELLQSVEAREAK